MTSTEVVGQDRDIEARTSSRLRRVAAEHPDLAALIVDDQVYTYAHLDVAADELAAALVRDLGPGDHRVGLRCAGTWPMVLGAAAISRAGMVSVPIDPTAPPVRVQEILDDVTSPLLLSDGELGEDVGRPVADPRELKAEVPPGGVDYEQGMLASVVFTTGSTGVPKGIMVPREHRIGLPGKVYYLGEIPEPMLIGSLAAGTVGFAEVMVHAAIQFGGTLNAYEIRRLGLGPLPGWLASSGVQGFAAVPTVVRLMTAVLPSDAVFPDLRLVVLTGETSTWEDVAALRPHLPPDAVIYNSFGLTETNAISVFAVDQSMALGQGPLPAGRVVPRAQVSIVDPDGRPVPDGERGEIVVSGEGCTLGYWARPELTAKVFTELPDGTRQVRTGDGGRFLPDGTLEHLGRLDHLVKISGNRVELGDVEAGLRSLDGVAAAAAAAFTDSSGSTRLAAFVVAKPGAELQPWVLRSALARRLPGPMLPDHIQVVDELPQLANGKVDRKLLAQRAPEAGAALSDEASDLERSLMKLFAGVLDRVDVGLDDNFFELGGDSLRAARLFSQLETSLGIDRPVALILEAPTVRSLAATITAGEKGLGLLVPVATDGSLPPLFVVHDGMGDVFYATRIAAGLGPDRPVYAIQPAMALGDDQDEHSIVALAARYLKDVRRLRPHGPYHLYGYSLGGLIAFEMARQLHNDGEEVGLLGLGDSPAPYFPWPQRVKFRIRELSELPSDQRWKRVKELANGTVVHGVKLARHRWASRGATPPASPAERVDAMFTHGDEPDLDARGREVMRRYGSMIIGYQPPTRYEGKVLLVRAGGAGAQPDRGWGRVVKGVITVRDIDSEHGLMGRDPAAQEVAGVLRDALEHLEVQQQADAVSGAIAS